MKAPVPANESERLAALREYRILDTSAERAYDDIVCLAAHICGVPMATISFVDADRQWFKARLGVTAQETSRDVAFCAHTILGDGPMIIGDAMADERFVDNLLVRQEPEIRFYAGFPLTTSEGLALGALCAMDRQPRRLSHEQEEAMTALSRQIMHILELRRISARLAVALEKITTLEGLLSICAWCKRIREETGAWTKVETYIKARSSAEFTHGICPDCYAKVNAGRIPATLLNTTPGQAAEPSGD